MFKSSTARILAAIGLVVLTSLPFLFVFASKFEIDPGKFLFSILAIIVIAGTLLYLGPSLAILVHEGGHWLVAKFCGFTVHNVRIFDKDLYKADKTLTYATISNCVVATRPNPTVLHLGMFFLGGSGLNLLMVPLSYWAYQQLNIGNSTLELQALKFFLLIFGISNLVFATSEIPGTSSPDGMMLTHLYKNPKDTTENLNYFHHYLVNFKRRSKNYSADYLAALKKVDPSSFSTELLLYNIAFEARQYAVAIAHLNAVFELIESGKARPKRCSAICNEMALFAEKHLNDLELMEKAINLGLEVDQGEGYMTGALIRKELLEGIDNDAKSRLDERKLVYTKMYKGSQELLEYLDDWYAHFFPEFFGQEEIIPLPETI